MAFSSDGVAADDDWDETSGLALLLASLGFRFRSSQFFSSQTTNPSGSLLFRSSE
jgi:hypothetical protein